MVRVDITYSDNLLDIIIDGHSGYADYGNDIVCAGVSAITYAAMSVLDDFNADIDISDGHCHIQARYTDDEQDYFDGVVEMIMSGYMAISEKYPDFVSISN